MFGGRVRGLIDCAFADPHLTGSRHSCLSSLKRKIAQLRPSETSPGRGGRGRELVRETLEGETAEGARCSATSPQNLLDEHEPA